jgi:UDP-N-acetylglucosamine--N-acetylmuramyl-(pentapeptide) pyrophosphoryl-undecaprenol N-acetylglucosamine transferase
MTTAPGAILIAAGGTGGHLFPAEALAHALKARGHVVELATDERADRYGHDFPARKVHLIAAATVNGRSPVALAGTALTLGRGTLQALPIVRRLKPAAAIGFGGYPTVPPLVAARLCGVPILLHEQNAVMGLGNRLLARFATAIATGFPNPSGLGAQAGIAVHTGNPVRPPVVAAAAIPYDPPQPGGSLRLLVFGGSQGARVFADLVPPAVAALDSALRSRLAIVQQTRDEDLARTRAAYAEIDVDAELAPFFTDLPTRMAQAHLVVARSGASTVAELAAIGRPSILVPLPHARDQDQAANAAVIAKAGGAWAFPQAELSPERLAAELTALLADPTRLSTAATAARTVGRPDAVERLADLVAAVAARRPIHSQGH